MGNARQFVHLTGKADFPCSRLAGDPVPQDRGKRFNQRSHRLMTNPALRCLRRPAAKRFDGKARKSVGYGAAKPDLLLIFGAADVVGSLRAFRR